MIRRILPLFVFLALLVIPSWVMAAASIQSESVNLMIEGESVQTDVPPVIKNGRTLVPVRVIAEGLGASVRWDQATSTATIEREKTKLILQLNSTKAFLNGKQVTLDAPPAIHSQRMLLPLRFVSEALGSTVGWDNATRTVIANHSLLVQVNGRDLSKTIKLYKVEDKLYAPIQLIAEQIGLKNTAWKQLDSAKTIESQIMLPISQVEEQLEARVTWDEQENRVEIDRLSRITEVSHEAKKVVIHTSKPITAEHFVLQGPHRIVLDLPQAVFSDDLMSSLAEADTEPAESTELTEESKSEEIDTDQKNIEESDLSVRSEKSTEEPPLITDVRYSQYKTHPQTVRIVIELGQKSKYNVVYTPDGIEVQLTPVPKKTGFLIVVDAGHGGKDQGAKGVTGNLEKDYNLIVAKRMIELLKQYPEFQVVATRESDVYLTLQERVDIANEADADLFLSIHANSFQPTTRGTETYYHNANSGAFAQVVHKHLLAATQFPDRKAKVGPFFVIKHTKMPAVLTETGFMSNWTENAQLTSQTFREKVAQALVAAIREYYQSYH